MKLRRIDSELVRRGIAPSRSSAARMIEEGRVKLDGQVVLKAARQMDPAQAIVVAESDEADYVSRGAHKLAGVLDALGDRAPRIRGRRALDAGASTGGFTDVLLRRGAASVVAVDVGYGQLAWKLQADPRVEVHDRTNVRTLDPATVAPAPELVVGDMSFISLTLVLPALVAAAAADADFLLMVKPQFEIGKERLGRGGVVRNPEHHVETVDKVARCAINLGLDIAAVAASPLPGPSGNVEYFIHMRRSHPHPIAAQDLTGCIRRAVAEGPAGGTS
ncbi:MULTISPECIES: TlyA family RNA methyltransferase [Actinomycetaceae]|uniref:TlyA family RNA methyltransferase n=1 Tax=Actinomycetaceae TaxID=2049 RepID=UPI0001F13BD4|nr:MULTISPECIES: TlyA family RNA methyltransferase [Actinomycetaceae]EFU61874.1 cytotoxin/hemolysin [Actinomyces sp. oral taxon 180 str. F0310]UUO94056.1 TlyA family RNA methyltransferase [Schaalia odontolytica]